MNDMGDFLARLDKIASDYQRRVMLIIRVQSIDDEVRLVRLCKEFCTTKPRAIEMVFNVTPRDLYERKTFFQAIIPFFAKAQVKIHLKNSSLHPAPVIYGNAGPYTISAEDWRAYKGVREEMNGFCIGGASVAIDVAKARKEGARLHDLAQKAAEALFLVGVARRRGNEWQGSLRARGFSASFVNEHVRFWNYDLEPGLLDELEAAKQVLDEFSSVPATVSEDQREEHGHAPRAWIVREDNASRALVRALQQRQGEVLQERERQACRDIAGAFVPPQQLRHPAHNLRLHRVARRPEAYRVLQR
jgi:hypothetical protein